MSPLKKLQTLLKNILKTLPTHKQTFLQKLSLYETIYDNLTTNTIRNRREIYYLSTHIFKNQKVLDNLIKNTCKQLNVEQKDLNITNTLKGLYYGKLKFVINNSIVDKNYGLNLIPDMGYCSKVLHFYECCVVVEKDCMFSKICRVYMCSDDLNKGNFDGMNNSNNIKENNNINSNKNDSISRNISNSRKDNINMNSKENTFSNKFINNSRDNNNINKKINSKVNNNSYSKENILNNRNSNNKKNILLICGKGYPCMNTLKLLTLLNIKTYGIFDFDPHGLEIYMCYKKSNISINKIGINLHQVINISCTKYIKLTKLDYVKIKNLCRYTELKDELIYMRDNDMKIEIESVFNDSGFDLCEFINVYVC